MGRRFRRLGSPRSFPVHDALHLVSIFKLPFVICILINSKLEEEKIGVGI